MISKNSLLGIQRYGCAALILLLATVPGIGWGQTNAPAATPASLPLEAQSAVNKGIIATKVPDYLLAIRYFEEARKTAPAAPEVFFNLGLAESKIPGRELRAIAWFSAYLAGNPTAPNAAAVKEKIAELQVKNQSSTSRLIKLVQDAAREKLPDEPKGSAYDAGERNDSFLHDAAKLWIEVGDIAAAQKTLSLFNDPNPESMFSSKSHTLRDIAIAQAESGDIAAAKKTANLMKDEYGKKKAQQLIAISQAKSGDIAGAKKTASLIKTEWERAWAQSAIAEVQAKAGDMVAAQQTFTSSLKTADLVSDAESKSRVQAEIATAQINASDIAGAQKTLAQAQKTAERIKDGEKAQAEKAIAEAEAKLVIASATGSRQTTLALPIQSVIIVSDWLKKLDDGNQDSDCPLNTDPFLDLADYLQTLPARWTKRYPSEAFIPAGERTFRMYRATAEKLVKAQNVITGMLKQQAQQQAGK